MALQPWIHVETFEEYKERFKDFAHMERTEDGILFLRMHWQGGPPVWSYESQRAYGELWTAIGHDKKNELMILTCQDPYWVCQKVDAKSFDEIEDSPGTDLKFNSNIPDTINFDENFINDIEIPVVAAINGIGQHYEFALFADITICVPDFFFSDGHFSNNIVPGDGMNFAVRVCCGPKRATYLGYMEPKIDAKTALEWGLINEIVDHDKLIDRAWEIARHIMKQSRPVRRLTHELAMRPWKRALQNDGLVHVYAEMYGTALQRTKHNFDGITARYVGDRPQEKK